MNLCTFQHEGEWFLKNAMTGGEEECFDSANEALQTATVRLANGGALELAAGDFKISQPLVFGSAVRISGSGAATRLHADEGFVGGALIIIEDADGASVERLTLLGHGLICDGVVLRNCVDCTVNGVRAMDFAQAGIVLRDNCSCCSVEHCSAAENGRANFLFENQAFGGRIGNFPPNLVTGCTSIGGGHGFEISKTTVFNITSCSAFQPRGHGFYIHHTSNSVLVSGCRTFQCDQSAVYVDDAHELNVSSCIFCWHRGDGVVLDHVNWAAINANEIIDSGVRDPDGVPRTALILKRNTKGVQAVGNTIFNWGDQPPMGHAVTEDPDCRENLIAMNHINYVSGEPIACRGTGTVVRDNLIVAKAAYRNMNKPPFPDFDRSAIERFLMSARRTLNPVPHRSAESLRPATL